MENYQNDLNSLTPRECFLMSLIHKLMKEYRTLSEAIRNIKPFKIIDIVKISNIPGETIFKIQITNKNLIINLKASEIILKEYDLNNFDSFHAEMIKNAAIGKLAEFLSVSTTPVCKIISKTLDKKNREHVFTIEFEDEMLISRTAIEILNDKNLLSSMQMEDILEVGFTQGSESILREQYELQSIRYVKGHLE